jgi:hypothetical protein
MSRCWVLFGVEDNKDQFVVDVMGVYRTKEAAEYWMEATQKSNLHMNIKEVVEDTEPDFTKE